MRILLFLLLLVVNAPGALAQAPVAGDDAAGEPRGAQVEEKRISDEEARRLVLAPLAAGRRAAREEVAIVRREQAAADAESVGRGEDFLWQVLLITVSALITALVWKWVND